MIATTLRRLTSERVAGRIAVVAGAVMAAIGATHAVRGDLARETIDRPIDHLVIGGLSLFLVLCIPAVIALGRRAGTALGRRAALAAATGQAALAIVAGISNVNGADPAWFVVAAPLANLLWAGGWIGLAVALLRTRAVARPLAVALPLSWVALLPLALVGGGLLAGGYWMALGTLMAAGALTGRGARPGRATVAVS